MIIQLSIYSVVSFPSSLPLSSPEIYKSIGPVAAQHPFNIITT